jgi:hypothetical protein
LLAGNITPDQHNEKLHKYFPDQPEWITTREDSDKGIHALNRNVSISSQANETLNGVDATVIVPDGMNISSIVNNDTSDANPVFQYEYTDGSKSDKFTKDNIPTAPAGKFIKNIHVHSDKVDPFHKMFSIDLMGVLAKQYRGDNNGTAEKTDKSQPAKGDKVSNLDQLITKIALTLPDSKTNPKHDPTSNDSVWYQGQIVLDKNPDTNIHFNQNEAEANQPSKQAGATGGTLTITQLDVQDEVPNLTYHVIIPINAVLNPDNPISNLPKNATVSYFDVNGRTVVKIQIKGGKREDIINKPFTLHLDNAAVINNKTLKSYWDVYVTVPDGQKSYDSFDTDNPSLTYDGYPRDEEDLKTDAFVENNKNSYWAYTSNHEWRLVTATVTQTTTEAVGNLLPSYAAVGKSDDKGSMDMKFSSTIMNADSNDVTHLTTILRMPNTDDGKSEFNFNLQKPVRVLDVATGQEVTDGVQIFYTTKKDYKSKKMENISKDDWQNDFTNSLPADPSTVTAVAVKIAKVPTQAFYRVVAEGTDPTLRTDAGNTAYVANKIWSDQLLPKNVEVGKTSTDDDTSLSAKITVFGESHIKVKFRYQKPDGSYEYINGDDLVLEDKKDTLKKEDLFKKVLGIDPETLKKDGNKLNDNPEFRQEITSRYPGLSDYAIDFSSLSDPTNPKGGDTAKWGESSKWYFDGNQVTFDLTKLQNSSPNVTLSRETTFVSKKEGSKLKEPINEPNFDADSLDISYDPLTKDYIVYDISNHLSYKEYEPKDDIPNYKLDTADAKLDGPSHTDIQKILKDNSHKLFESTHQHGMRIEITKNADGTYKADTPVEDTNIAPGNISIVYNQVAHYDEKLGNVTVHYVDVEDKANEDPNKTTFETTDGDELTDHKQNAAKDLQYGKSYTNTLWDYEKAGYELATSTTPEGATSGTIDSDNKDIYVYLKHKHTPITDTKTVNENINYVDQNGNALPKDVKDTTKRTITFKPSDGSYHDEVSKEDHVSWTPTGDFTKNGEETQFGTESTEAKGYDLDEDATKNDKNNPADTLNSDKDVAAVTVDPTKELKDITRTIHYKKKSSIKINYVDVEGLKKDDFANGKSVADGSHNISKDGHTGDSVYGESTPWDYEKDGWEFVESSSPVKPDLKIGDEPQEITVYLKHKHTSVKRTKIVKETINYVDQDGNALPKDVKDTTKRTITFNTTDDSYHDEVTNKDHLKWTATGDTDKNSESTQFATEPTTAKGFDLDENATKEDSINPSTVLNNDKDVAAVPVDEKSSDVNITVHYNQKAETHIHYIDVNDSKKTTGFDKNDGSAIDGHDVNHVGHINDAIFPDGKTPWDYTSDGWVLAENPSNVNQDMKLTKDTPHDVYVYLKHDTTDIQNPKKINVTETVHYVDEDGNPVKDENGHDIVETNKQNLTLTQTGKYDKAIKQNIPNGWSADKKGFSTLPTKDVPGYDVDKVYHKDQSGIKIDDKDQNGKSIKEVSYNPSKVDKNETKDQNVDVYVVLKKKAKTTVHYIDVEGVNKDAKDLTSKDGSTIENKGHDFTVKGHVGDTNVFSNNLWKFDPNEWEFVTQSPEIDEGKLTDKTPSDLYVYLKHKHSAIKTQPMTVNETVHYVDQDGKSIKDDSTAKMTLTPQGYYDEHTKKDVITGWKSDLKDSKFPNFDTAINGYDIDKDNTKSTDVTGDYNKVKDVPITVVNNQQPKDVDITIHYNKKAETHIHYIDVNDSKKTTGFDKNDGSAIDGHDVNHVGHINDAIFPDGKTPWDYTSDGWVLAENPSNVNQDMKLTKDTPHDVYVYLKHGTTDIQEPKKINVTETVHYVDEDGNPVKDENGHDIVETNKQNLTLTQTGKYDKAIKQNIPDGWSADETNFATLPIKDISGYDLDKVYHEDQDGKKVDDKDQNVKSIKEVSYDPSKVKTDETEDQNVNVYVVLKKQAKTTVHYIDVEGVDKDAKDLTPNDGSTIDNESHNFTVDGHVGDDFSDKLWGYDPNEWELVT